MSSTNPGLVARDLRKSYPGGRKAPRIQALDGLSIEVEAGTIFGLLGPNGAGKSTTVKILSTLSRADSGTAEVAGIDVARHPDKVRRVIGFVAQKPVADPMDTGRENLVLAGRLQGMRGSDAASSCDRTARAASRSPTPPTGWSRPTRAAWPASSTSRSA